jgi:hypothetical protein
MGRTLFWASVAVAGGLILYFIVVGHVPPELVSPLSWLVPLLGGSVAACVAPRDKIRASAIAIIPTALIIGIGSYLAGRLGFGDFIGAGGTLFMSVLMLPEISIWTVAGGALGAWASKRRTEIRPRG